MSKALTALSEEEVIFRETVREFAKEKLAPLAGPMDQEGKLDSRVVPWLFELGLMGIEIPERVWWRGCHLLHVHSRYRRDSRDVDPAVAVVCDVQNTLVVSPRYFVGGTMPRRSDSSDKLAGGNRREPMHFPRPIREVTPLRSSAAARRGWRRVRAQWSETLDHKRQRKPAFIWCSRM